MRRPLAFASLSSLVLVTAVTGCEQGTPSASDLVNKAKANSTSAKSVALYIEGDVNGTKTTMQVDGRLDGSNQQQRQTQKDARNEGIILNKRGYLKGNQAFWTALGARSKDAAKLKDKWWVGEASGSDANPSINVKDVINTYARSADGKAAAAEDAKVTETTTAGQETYTITPKDTSKAKLIVTRGDKPRIVQITGYESDLTKTKANYTFSKWDSVEAFQAPKGAKPISEAGLSGS